MEYYISKQQEIYSSPLHMRHAPRMGDNKVSITLKESKLYSLFSDHDAIKIEINDKRYLENL